MLLELIIFFDKTLIPSKSPYIQAELELHLQNHSFQKYRMEKIGFSTTGIFNWGGATLHGQKAPIGIYVLWIEYFNLNGEVGQMKEAIVVAEKF